MLKNIIHFSSSNLYRHLLGLLTSIFRPVLLGPELYGLWNLINIIPSYASYLHLGSRTAMRYSIPQLERQQSWQQLTTTKTSALSGAFIVNAFVAIILLVVATFSSYDTEANIGLAVMAGVILLGCLYEHHISELKGHQNFLLVSKSNYVRYSLNFIFTVLLIYPFGFYGALLALLCSLILSTLYLAKQTKFTLPAAFNLHQFLSSTRIGFPILALDFVTILLRSVDKLLITLWLGAEALGFYAIATMLLGPLMNIPGASREVVEQVLMEKKHQLSQQQQLKNYFFKSLRYSAYLMPLLIAIAYLGLPLFVDLILDDYVPAVIPTQTLLLGSYFLALTYPCRGVIVANHWQVNAALVALLAVLFNIIFSTVALQADLGIFGVALSASCSFLCLFFILSSFILKRFQQSFKDYVYQLIELFIPFIFMCGGLWLVNQLSQQMQFHPLLDCFITIGIFMLLYLPFLYGAKQLGRIGNNKGSTGEQ